MASGDNNHIPFSIPASDTSFEIDDAMDGFVEQTNQVISIMYEERYIEEHPDICNMPLPVREVAERVEGCDPQVKQLGQRLAAVGDEIEKQYGSKIDSLVKDFFKSEEGSYFDRFKAIAMGILGGTWNMGRIMALLMFGYKIAVSKLTDCTSSFFLDVIKLVVKFLFFKNILGWVKDKGGWGTVADSATSSALQLSMASLNSVQTVVVIFGVVAIAGILLVKFGQSTS